MLLWFKAEGVDVDAGGRNVGVVLVGLDKIEVTAHALRETIVTVKLELSGEDGIEAGVNARDGVVELGTGGGGVRVREEFRGVGGGDRTRNIRLEGRRHITVRRCGGASSPGHVNSISVIEPLFAEDAGGGRGVNVRILLDNPDKFFAGVVEVKLDLVGDRGDRLVTGELNLLDEVLVRDLREAAALISVEEDVVRVEGRGLERGDRDGTLGEVAIRSSTELKVDLDLVVLEGDKRKSKSGVAAEPELKRDVKIHLGDEGLRSGLADGELGKGRDVTDHVLVANLLAGSLGKLVPDVHPVTVVLVDALATDLNLGVLDKIVAEVVEPAELVTVRDGDLGDGDLEVYTREKITIAGDGACHALAEIGGTVEGLLDGLHREIGMATIHYLKEGNLRVACKIDILGPVRY